jgi:hypothetical protein
MPAHYQIRVRGHLGSHGAAWFDGLTVTNEESGDAILEGPLADQAALYGVLIKVRDLGLPLLSVTLVPPDAAQPAAGDELGERP